MKGLLGLSWLQLGPTGLLGPLFFLLIGVAFAQDAPGTWVVDTGSMKLPLGDLSLPAALVIFGRMMERGIAALAQWRPGLELHVHHRHVQIAQGDPPTKGD